MEEIKHGYKQTDIGVFPEYWEILTVDQIIKDISMGPFGSDIKVSNFVSEGVPVLNGYNVSGHKLLDTYSNYVTSEKARSLKKAVAKKGDIVITHRGTIGQISFIPYDSSFESYVISQSQFRITVNEKKVVPEYFVLYFHSNVGQSTILESKGHTGVPAIAQPTTTFRKFTLPIPPLKEQIQIIEKLNDTEKLIAALDKKIAKKQQLKQGAMQQLLTGKKRLPGFDGEWVEKHLGECFIKIIGGGTPSRSNADYWNGNIPWATVKDFATFNPTATQEYITHIGLTNSSSHLIPKFTPITSTRMGLGKIVVYHVDVAINQDLKALFIKEEYDKNYVVHWFNFSSEIIEALGTGSTVKGIRLEQLKTIPIYLSNNKDEQTAIAQILTDMDNEITRLEKERDKYVQLKAGMMQVLLTGKIRLIKN